MPDFEHADLDAWIVELHAGGSLNDAETSTLRWLIEHGDFDELLQLEPGQPITPEMFTALKMLYWGTNPILFDQFLVCQWGVPCLPRPVIGNPDGTGRIASWADETLWRHPVWWLPDDLRHQRIGEPDDVWQMRLFAEIESRGYFDRETGFVDPLKEDLGLDPSDPNTQARIAAFQKGGLDDELASFVLGDGIVPRDELEAQVVAVHESARNALHVATMEQMRVIADSYPQVHAGVEALDFDDSATELVSALHALQQAARNGTETDTVFATARTAVDTYIAWLNTELWGAVLAASTVLVTFSPEYENHPDHMVFTRGELAWLSHQNGIDRELELSKLFDPIIADPTRDDLYAALITAFRDEFTLAKQTALEAINDADTTMQADLHS